MTSSQDHDCFELNCVRIIALVKNLFTSLCGLILYRD